jgi:hypothetical protein
MHVFDQLTLLDSLILVLGMYVSCAMVGSIVFLILGTPWEFTREWRLILQRELLRIVVGYATGILLVYLNVTVLS